MLLRQCMLLCTSYTVYTSYTLHDGGSEVYSVHEVQETIHTLIIWILRLKILVLQFFTLVTV